MGKDIKYWKSLDELKETPELLKSKGEEFSEQLPSDVFNGLAESSEITSTNRRDFLKFMGFSLGAAALAACETPVTKTIPYVVKPEVITPGVANWYSSTYADGSDYCSILIKTREGRPIKIEGNKLSGVTKGGVNARVQGSLLSLYDKARLRGAMQNKGGSWNGIEWKDADNAIGAGLDKTAADGKTIAVLSSSVLSPSTKQVIADFSAKYPTVKHVTYDAVSVSAIAKAHGMTHGKKMIPNYRFDNAKVIVSIGADFLVNWVSPIEYAGQYAVNRKVSKDKKEMSRHVQIETTLSVTGSNADYRLAVKPSQLSAAVVQLHNALSGGSLPVSNKVDAQFIKQTADWLSANKGKALVVCGVNDAPTQLVVNEINKWLGSYGTTIDNSTSNNMRQGDDEQFASLVNDMKEGKVGAILLYNCNPVYNTSAGLGFADALKKVGLKVSFSGYADETSGMCDFICPDSHYLESWNDSNPSGNHYSLGQPAIAPLFKTRQFQDSLLLWSGNNAGYHSYIQKQWETKMFPMQKEHGDFVSFWNRSLHDGVFIGSGEMVMMDEDKKKEEPKKKVAPIDSVMTPTPAPMMDAGMDLNGAATTIAAVKGGDLEVFLYEKAAIGNGSSTANNPWLVELPDPISRVTWGNYVTMNPEDMRGKYGMLERQERWGNTATLTLGKTVLENIPVFPQPGQTRGTVGVALGYGQTSGKVAQMVEGFNAYPAVQWVNGTPQYYTVGATLSEATGKHEFACTQQQHTMMGRKIVNETDLTTYQEKPVEEWNVPTTISIINKEGHHEKKGPDQVTLWDELQSPDISGPWPSISTHASAAALAL
jgi:MoCo/4Fe-4S cofactor protein with predicted Tat translocation signal